MNGWLDIKWFNTQFILIPNFSNIGALRFSRHFLDWNLIFAFRNQRFLLTTHTKVNALKSLPFFYYQSHNDTTNFMNAQKTKNPSDIIFFMSKNQYIEWGKKFIESGQEYEMRLSNNSIVSYLHGPERYIYWNIFGIESLLVEPLSFVLLKLKVRYCII